MPDLPFPLSDRIDYRGYTIEIFYDQDPLNPETEFDGHIGKMLCFHQRYDLGDPHPGVKSKNFSGWEDIEEYIENELEGLVIMPLFLYDHSGITISTSRTYPFNDRWDAGQVGFIYATKKTISDCFDDIKFPLDDETMEKIKEYMVAQVEEYDDYLTGEVYGWRIIQPSQCKCCGHDTSELVDSCCGFYGEEGRKYATDEAKSMVDSIYSNA